MIGYVQHIMNDLCADPALGRPARACPA